MTYTGDVSRGGPSALQECSQLLIRKIEVGEMGNNAYLLTCRSSGAQLLIDAAAEPDRLTALAGEGSPDGQLDAIVTTHQHADHHGALSALVAATGARTYAGADDADGLPVEVDVRLEHGDTVPVGKVDLQVAVLRGHTPGSVALIHRDDDGSVHAFTGDSLFPGGVGNTGSDAGRFSQLIDDVEERLFAALPDHTRVYPGHGADTTIGVERPQLPEWRARGW